MQILQEARLGFGDSDETALTKFVPRPPPPSCKTWLTECWESPFSPSLFGLSLSSRTGAAKLSDPLLPKTFSDGGDGGDEDSVLSKDVWFSQSVLLTSTTSSFRGRSSTQSSARPLATSILAPGLGTRGCALDFSIPLGLTLDRSLTVAQVAGQAEAAGVLVGDLVLEVGGEPVADIRAFHNAKRRWEERERRHRDTSRLRDSTVSSGSVESLGASTGGAVDRRSVHVGGPDGSSRCFIKYFRASDVEDFGSRRVSQSLLQSQMPLIERVRTKALLRLAVVEGGGCGAGGGEGEAIGLDRHLRSLLGAGFRTVQDLVDPYLLPDKNLRALGFAMHEVST